MPVAEQKRVSAPTAWDWDDPDSEPRCPDHSFSGTNFRWSETRESWMCHRCEVEARQLDEAGL